jgi:hypothetical protein
VTLHTLYGLLVFLLASLLAGFAVMAVPIYAFAWFFARDEDATEDNYR